jgi:hypothetical protein
MSLQIMNSDFGLYRHLGIVSSLFRNSLISLEGALYKVNTFRLADLVSS